jgi:hypothetical protein
MANNSNAAAVNFPFAILHISDPISGAGPTEKYYWNNDNVTLTGLFDAAVILGQKRAAFCAKGTGVHAISWGIESNPRSKRTVATNYLSNVGGNPPLPQLSLMYEGIPQGDICAPCRRYLCMIPPSVMTDYGINPDAEPGFAVSFGAFSAELKQKWGFKGNVSTPTVNPNQKLIALPTTTGMPLNNAIVQVLSLTNAQKNMVVNKSFVRWEGAKGGGCPNGKYLLAAMTGSGPFSLTLAGRSFNGTPPFPAPFPVLGSIKPILPCYAAFADIIMGRTAKRARGVYNPFGLRGRGRGKTVKTCTTVTPIGC